MVADGSADDESPTDDDGSTNGDESTAVDYEEMDQDALESAIAEDPEAVAAFVRRLDAVNELLDVLALGEGALSDEMVRELAGTSATLAESADGLATDGTVVLAGAVGENGEELRDALETVVELQQSGTLSELSELAEVVSLATAALDDEMVTSIAGTGSGLAEVAQTAGEEDTRKGIETLLDGVATAEGEQPEAVGTLDLLRSIRDPEVQYGLGYMISIARAIGQTRSGE